MFEQAPLPVYIELDPSSIPISDFAYTIVLTTDKPEEHTRIGICFSDDAYYDILRTTCFDASETEYKGQLAYLVSTLPIIDPHKSDVLEEIIRTLVLIGDIHECRFSVLHEHRTDKTFEFSYAAFDTEHDYVERLRSIKSSEYGEAVTGFASRPLSERAQ